MKQVGQQFLRLVKQPWFRDFPDNFSIDEYEIDKDHWQEGFGGPDPTQYSHNAACLNNAHLHRLPELLNACLGSGRNVSQKLISKDLLLSH